MDQNVRQQRLNLAGFVRGLLMPARLRLEQAWRVYSEAPDSAPLKDKQDIGVTDFANNRSWQDFGIPLTYSQCSLWEAYLWLHLGVEVGFFPDAESAELVGQGLPVSRQLAEHFQHLYPASLQILISDAIRKRREGPFPTARYERFDSQKALRVPLQMALMLESGYAREAATQPFTIATSLIPQPMWEALTSGDGWNEGDFSSEELDRSLDSQSAELTGFRREHLLAGFVRSVRHMANLVEFLEALRASGTLGERDLNLFGRRIKEICFWRLNFLTGTAKSRFESFIRIFSLAISSERARQQLVSNWQPNPLEFQRHINELMTNWSRGVQQELAATA